MVGVFHLCTFLFINWNMSLTVLGFQNVPDGSVAELLKTAERDPLHLVAFLQNGHLSGIYVVGDTVTIGVPIRSVESAVFTLFASYYVFNVDYPRQYAMFFAILQSLVLQQQYLKPTSKKYAFLVKKLREAIQVVPATSEEDEEPLAKKRAVVPQKTVIGDSRHPAGNGVSDKRVVVDSAANTATDASHRETEDSSVETNRELTGDSCRPTRKALPERARRGKNKKFEQGVTPQTSFF